MPKKQEMVINSPFNLDSLIHIIYIINYFIARVKKHMQNASPEQIEKAFRLCDMLGMEDVTIAFSILENLNWDIEKAIEVMQDTSKNESSSSRTKSKEEAELPENYTYDPADEPEQEQDDEHFEYVYDREEENKNKRRMFDQAYEEIKLDRSTTDPPNKLEKRLSIDRHMIEDFSHYRHAYQLQLLEDSQKFCKKLLGENSQQIKQIDRSKIRNEINRNFICYLSKNYRCSINFTFGTFLLNLVRSYLDKKYLLVYIHQMEYEDSRSLRMLLSHKETTKFINQNFVCYGMFDNCDDYEIVQQYVPMKDLPAFALFKYSKKTKKEKFMGAYQVLQKEPSNFMEWLATSIGVSISKKSIQPKSKTEQKKSQVTQKNSKQIITHRDIMSKQNEQYEQMQRIYKLRRQESQIKKDEILNAEKAIEKMKEKFKDEVKMEDGKTIEIKFRLPESGKSITRIFKLNSPVKDMFDYVSCFGRGEFEQRYANFDLTQTFPRLSLFDEQKKTIQEIFEASSHENVIVKEL